jgi:PhzF family phenazine biosynthesis protein
MENRSKQSIPIYQLDAFTDLPFKGNPAAVCLLGQKLGDNIMQAIAAEMNLSETAFVSSLENKPIKETTNFSLRWFTPKVEVPLCGHATLASAAVLFYEINLPINEITFETLSGKLIAIKDPNGILLNFPSNPPEPIEPPEELLKALGITEYKNIANSKPAGKLLIQLENENAVKNVRPDFELMKSLPIYEGIIGIIITSEGKPPIDFISRFFAPWVGVNEDPVTGSAHTVLTPYWSKVLGKQEMTAYQASERGGKLVVQLHGDRVNLIGKAVMVLKGGLNL